MIKCFIDKNVGESVERTTHIIAYLNLSSSVSKAELSSSSPTSTSMSDNYFLDNPNDNIPTEHAITIIPKN